jgi:hypothetical protein
LCTLIITAFIEHKLRIPFSWGENQCILHGLKFKASDLRAFGHHRNTKNAMPDEAMRKLVAVLGPFLLPV